MEYLSFVLVMHLLAVSFAWKEYQSMSTVFIEKGGHTNKQTNSNFITKDNISIGSGVDQHKNLSIF